jgi:hypothetical protein
MIEDLVRNLKSNDVELQMHCASAIFKVSIDSLCVASVPNDCKMVAN